MDPNLPIFIASFIIILFFALACYKNNNYVGAIYELFLALLLLLFLYDIINVTYWIDILFISIGIYVGIITYLDKNYVLSALSFLFALVVLIIWYC